MKKKVWQIVILPNIVLILLCCAMIGLLRENTRRQLHMERVNSMNQISEKVGENLDILLDSQWNQVRNAVRILERQEIRDTEQAAGALKKIEGLLGYEENTAGVIDSNGFYYRSDGEKKRWDSLLYLTSDKAEEQVEITNSSILEQSEEQIIFLKRLDTPMVLTDGTGLTHLTVILNMDDFSDTISLGSFQREATTYIIRRDGTMVYHQHYTNDFGTAYNILRLLERGTVLYGDSYEDMCRQIEDGRDGTVETELDGNSWFISYRNAGVRDWYLLQITPTAALSAYVEKYMKMSTVYISLIAIFGSILVIFNVGTVVRLRFLQEKENTAEMARLAEDAQSASQSKSVFLSSMSHDIRTPLNGIIGMTEIAKRNVGNPVKVQDCLEKISVGSGHLLSLINDILDMSRIERGRTEIAYKPFDMQGLLDECSTLINNQVESRNISFVREYSSLTHTRLMGDKVHIKQILINILGNSVKFSNEGGRISLTVTELEAKSGRACFRFVCSDTGIGMSKEFQEKIFIPFEQANVSDRNNQKGSGLGMAIVRELVDLMDGKLELESEPGQGTTFTLTLTFDVDEGGSG